MIRKGYVPPIPTRGDYLGARIERYVRRYYARHEHFPDAVQIARALNTGPAKVLDEVDACGELPLMITNGRHGRQLGYANIYVEILE